MKAVILAGGLGTRITEESYLKPKPMIEIGAMPILWHIMKIYSSYGINDFIICAGYKSTVIKDYFSSYFIYKSNVKFDFNKNSIELLSNYSEPWTVTVVDTGENTMTGGRLKRIKDYIGDEDFCCTYGDGVSDINISELVAFHKEHGSLATVTAVTPAGRFGALSFDGDKVSAFQEKPDGDGAWVSAGFFVLNKKVLDYISDDSTIFEREPLETLAQEGHLRSFKHKGFWQPMDTLRDKLSLEKLWDTGVAPWKVWSD